MDIQQWKRTIKKVITHDEENVMKQNAESIFLRTIEAAEWCQGPLWQHAGLNAVVNIDSECEDKGEPSNVETLVNYTHHTH